MIFEYFEYLNMYLVIDKKNQRTVMDDEISICRESIDRLSDIFL